MQHDTVPAPDADWSASRQHVTRQRAAVQREVAHLLDDLAPERPPPRREETALAVRAYRWPTRCILQGASSAVSVSWFPGDANDRSLGEMLVIAWDGVVSLPGSGRREPTQAVPVRSIVLQPLEVEGRWTWRAENGDDRALDTIALATTCRELLGR